MAHNTGNYSPGGALDSHIDLLYLPQHKAPPLRRNVICVPQRQYDRGTGKNKPEKRGKVLFFQDDGSFPQLKAALEETHDRLNDRDELVLLEAGHTVTVRFEWPGYPPQDYQLRTLDWCTTPNKIPRSKLAHESAKLVKKFIEGMEREQIDPNHAAWRVGPNGIGLEHLSLAAFEQVSTGSWQLRLFYTCPA